MNLEKKGKIYIITIIVIILFQELILLSLDFLSNRYGDFLTSIIRTSLECIILIYLYKGRKWAKNLFVILLLIGGLAFISLSILYYNSPIHLFFLLPFGILFIGIALALLLSKSINAFMLYQREKSKVEIDEIVSEQQDITNIRY